MSKSLFSTGVSALFDMATSDAHRILPRHLTSVEIRPQRSVLSVSVFHFHETTAGPYAEVVLSVLVPPKLSGWGWAKLPKVALFPFMAATSSRESRNFLREAFHLPVHDDTIDVRFVEREDRVQVQVWCQADPVLQLVVTRHEWEANTHHLHAFMMDGDQRYKADVQISGTYTMHEKEAGSLILHPHPITRHLQLDEVSPRPFREHWLKEGFELFHPLEAL